MISLEKLQQYSLGLVLIGFLFPMRISNAFMIIFLAISLFALIKKKAYKLVKQSYYFIGFFLLFPIALSYTADIDYGLRIIERNVVWLLIPLLVPQTLRTIKDHLQKPLVAFAFATHFLALFLMLAATWNYFETRSHLVFYYDNLVDIIDFHPIYLSTYLLFSLLILWEAQKKGIIKVNRYVIIGIIGFNFLALTLLSSKAMIATFLILFLFENLKGYKNRKRLLLSIMGVLLMSVIVMQFSETKKRINDSLFSSWELLKKDTFQYNDPFTGVTLRLITWKFVMKKFIDEENILIGLGTGDAREFINQVYRDHNMDAGGYINFNMHNQYLEYFLKFGLIGILYFLTLLVMSFKKAIETKNRLYLYFLIVFCIFSITESSLEVQRGILFFVLLNTLFYFTSNKELTDA